MPSTGFALVKFAVLVVLATLALGASPALAAGPTFQGVQLHSLWGGVSNADMDRELDMTRDAGANVVRVDVGWSSLETAGKGQWSQWYVDKLDRFMDGADARGIKVIATLWGTPCWASTAPETKKQGCAGTWWDRQVTMYPPTSNSHFADAASFVTKRYGTKLAALEVWNEPNLPEDRFWIAPDEPAAYAALVKAAYPAVKAANPAVDVLAGSLAGSDRPFLEALYANGIKGYYDGISIHPYNEWRSPADRWQPEWKKYTFLPGTEWVREGQLAAGDSKPLWLTEFGWTSCSGGGWCVSAEKQAEYTHQAFDILETKDYVKAAVAYNLREKGSDPASFEDNFGLVNADFSPKPAYAAMRAALTDTTPAPPVPPVVTPPVSSPPPVQLPPVATPPVGPAPPTVPLAPSAPSSPATPDAEAPRQPVRKRGLARKVSVTLKRRGKLAYASGRAPAGTRLTLRLRGCKRVEVSRAHGVLVGKSGRFSRRVGTAAKLAGCRVAASASR